MNGQDMNRQDANVAKAEPDDLTDELAHEVIGAAIEVHRHLGPGYLESLYEEAMAVEPGLRKISFRRQEPIAVRYKGHDIGEGGADFLTEKHLLVELKAADALAPIHTAQVISYLKAMEYRLGLLINFNVPVLRAGIQRVVFS